MGLRHAAIAVLIAMSSMAPPAPCGARVLAAAQRIDTAATVARLRDYVLTWQHSLAAVVAEERYVQTLTHYPRGREVVSRGNQTTKRTLVSDVLLVHAPAENSWLMFRDVMSVDGAAVHDRQRRFDELFARPDANLVATARRIADEGARYNLGMTRNVNTPTAALAFLDERYKRSVRWRTPERVTRDGTLLLSLEFEQTRAPFAIHSPAGEPRPTKGTFWIEPASGRIVRTTIEMTALTLSMSRAGQPLSTRGFARVSADFGPVAGVEPWVPLRMADEYDVDSRFDERLTGEAAYTNHRLFQTGARIIGGAR